MIKRKLKYFVAVLVFSVTLLIPRSVNADFWGGDLPLLAQIVFNTLQQLSQLRTIVGNAQDTLHLLEDINSGIRDAMVIIKTMNTTIQPGILGELQNPEQVLRVIERLYGAIPQTAEARTQALTDQSVAEAITLHNQAFDYASRVDPEAERIKDYSRNVSPLGAERLTAESVGVLIHVMNQILRTNAALLKINSENLALQNKKEKLNSQQFKMQYDGLSQGFLNSQSNYDLPSLSGSNHR